MTPTCPLSTPWLELPTLIFSHLPEGHACLSHRPCRLTFVQLVPPPPTNQGSFSRCLSRGQVRDRAVYLVPPRGTRDLLWDFSFPLAPHIQSATRLGGSSLNVLMSVPLFLLVAPDTLWQVPTSQLPSPGQ